MNGWPAIIARSGGTVIFVINIETDAEKIATIRSVLNPDKLLPAPRELSPPFVARLTSKEARLLKA